MALVYHLISFKQALSDRLLIVYNMSMGWCGSRQKDATNPVLPSDPLLY